MATPSNGVCRINGVEVVEFALQARGSMPGAGLVATYALVNIETGNRFGRGTFNVWSEETTEKLNAAIKSMEADISSLVFDGVRTPTDSGVDDRNPLEDGVPGL